jgi:hypothetical protein
MSDEFDKTSIFKRFKATQGAPDPFADSTQATIAFDEVLTPLGIRAPMRRPNESEADHLARLGEHAAAFGPEDRKRVNRYNLPSAALAEFVRQDLEIARQEIEHPRYSLKPGELREVVKTDRSGRPIHEFYSDEATGTKPWLDAFKPAVIKYVSGGSKGIATNDDPTGHYHFNKSEIIPELVELQRQAAFADSAEGKIIAAYASVGKTPPDEVLAQLKKA